MFFASRRRREELDAVKAEADRQRIRAEKAEGERDTAIRNRRQVLVQNAALHAANQRLEGRRKELGRRLDAAHDGQLVEGSEIFSLEARAQRLVRAAARYRAELSAARADMDAKVAAAEERGRQAGRAMSPEEWLGRPVDGAPAGRREPSAELRLAHERGLQLADRLAALQTSHVADTRELHDLRSKGGAS